MNAFERLMHRPFFIRLFHWEYWSFNTVYLPIYIIWVGLCIRARSFFFFAASNPTITNGGFLNESKKEIAALIPAELQPRTVFFSLPAEPASLLPALTANNIRFPMIGKPDIGGRGRGVELLRDAKALEIYATRSTVDFHVQEFVAMEHEVGIFYYRYPGESNGHISGIVTKEFLTVTGDGVSTVKQLMQKNKRALLQLAGFEKDQPQVLARILPNGTRQLLVPYGNHARGAKFIDDSALIDETLSRSIDAACQRIPGFYYGRLDIRYRNWEELRRGENFSIIEVNGAGSEPTHMYDPKHSIFFAWKEIVRHWLILWNISRKNHRLGFPYLTLKQGIAMFRGDKENSARLEKMTNRPGSTG